MEPEMNEYKKDIYVDRSFCFLWRASSMPSGYRYRITGKQKIQQFLFRGSYDGSVKEGVGGLYRKQGNYVVDSSHLKGLGHEIKLKYFGKNGYF